MFTYIMLQVIILITQFISDCSTDLNDTIGTDITYEMIIINAGDRLYYEFAEATQYLALTSEP